MANNNTKFSKLQKNLRSEISLKTQRKNASIRRTAECAAKKLYKAIRPTIVMHKVRGNELFLKLDESLELLIYISHANDFELFGPGDSADPHIKMACPGRKKRAKLFQKDRELFDRIYIEEVRQIFNLDALNQQEYQQIKL